MLVILHLGYKYMNKENSVKDLLEDLITELYYCIENEEDYKRVKTYLENKLKKGK